MCSQNHRTQYKRTKQLVIENIEDSNDLHIFIHTGHFLHTKCCSSLTRHEGRATSSNRTATAFLSTDSYVQVWDNMNHGTLRWEAADVGAERMGAVVENSVIQSACFRAASESPNITFLWPWQLQGTLVSLLLSPTCILVVLFVLCGESVARTRVGNPETNVSCCKLFVMVPLRHLNAGIVYEVLVHLFFLLTGFGLALGFQLYKNDLISQSKCLESPPVSVSRLVVDTMSLWCYSVTLWNMAVPKHGKSLQCAKLVYRYLST